MSNRFWELKAMLCNEDGAVTIDWVVLTSSLVALGFTATVLIWQETGRASGKISEHIGEQQVVPAFAAEEVSEDKSG
ncbi:hypothetical protein [Thioclava sp. F36-7]|uniref:hypothetical protein n=1 Tax=Thioclava sp. F36-7 TaxID=1915317 RepID=UPI000996ACC4|nr:hypothetical protein [Thioclava sp. F36-7]OOY08024.1 hypothetical protein BMI89_14175 [Thioclava sp. F36-7]